MTISEEILNTTAFALEPTVHFDYSTFVKLGKEHFGVDVSDDLDALYYVKESSRFFHLSLPSNLNEYFIKYEDAALFWIYESPILNQLEEFMKIQLSSRSANYGYKLIKEHFSKWVIAKTESQKKVLASSTINLIRKEGNSGRILNSIYKNIILIYDKSHANPQKAIDELTKIKETSLNSKALDIIRDEICYLLELYAGFGFMKLGNNNEASLRFNAALAYKPYGMTAKFYLAYIYLKLQQTEIASYLVREIYNYDLYRLAYAVESNHAIMFQVFIKNAIINNIFYYEPFAALQDILTEKIEDTAPDAYLETTIIKEKLSLLNKLKLEDYYSEPIIKINLFLQKMLRDYDGNKFQLFIISLNHLTEKFKSLIKTIQEAIKEKIQSEYKDALGLYDEKIKENNLIINQFMNELNNAKDDLQKNLKESIAKLERIAFEHSGLIEHRIEHLHLEKEYDPNLAFQNSMTYNFIISLTVFLIGGFAGYSNATIGGNDYREILGSIMLTGFKWSFLTFAVGFLIALVLAGIVVFDKASQRQKLFHKLSYIKSDKDRRIVYAKKEAEIKEKSINDNYADRIARHKKTIEDLVIQKEEDELKYKQEAEAKTKPFSEKLQEIHPGLT